MSKVADYLREHVVGEIVTGAQARKFFSTDASIFSVTPQVVVYPRTTDDVRKIARFSSQLAERGKHIPITARGAGSDQTGGAVGSGIVLVFPAHMNKLLQLDTKKNLARVQPGINYRNFQDTIKTHGRFLPPYPSSSDYSTIGGAVANNSSGERTVKYGDTRKFVESLQVVLSNGELIQTGRLTKRELNHKKGLATFEGEVYRQLDGLVTDNRALIETMHRNVSKNSTGYDLIDVKMKDGSFDLTPLMVGSQGTLGIITEIDVDVVPNNMNRSLAVIGFSDLKVMNESIEAILKLAPAAIEMVDRHLLEFIEKHYPNQLKGLLEAPFPEVLLFVEFDDIGKAVQSKKLKKLTKLLRRVTDDFQTTQEYDEREELWKIRHCTAALMTHTEGKKKSIPIIEDGIVPVDELSNFLPEIYALFKKYDLEVAVWGHAGDANLHVQPFIDLAAVGDRQRIFKIMDEYYDIIVKLGGSISGEHNDGRLRGPYLEKLYGPEVYKLLEAVKKVFDPHNILNPGVKVNTTHEDQLHDLRREYTIEHLNQYLPRS